ncbi:MAG TPA: helical backbone metal receptor [Phycisphaerae bacterium]|nr:helical backbone metal receptor [Phycisphaerae bacterium]
MNRATRYLGLVLALAMAAGGCDESASPERDVGEDEPLRILSLAPNVTEILFAMGQGKRMVGRSTYCKFPPQAARLPAVGDTINMNLEKIVALKPNLALVVTKRDDVVRTLEGLGVHTVALECDTMAELYQTIDTIGRETGAMGPAMNLRDMIRDGLSAVRRRVAGRPRPKVLFAFPMTVGSAKMMVAGRGTFVDELLDVAGAENAYPEAGDWPTITPQQAVAMAPEIVIVNAVGDQAAPDRIEAIRRAWADLKGVPAVVKGRVIVLQDAYLTIPGPGVGLAAERLANVIHGLPGEPGR